MRRAVNGQPAERSMSSGIRQFASGRWQSDRYVRHSKVCTRACLNETEDRRQGPRLCADKHSGAFMCVDSQECTATIDAGKGFAVASLDLVGGRDEATPFGSKRSPSGKGQAGQ